MPKNLLHDVMTKEHRSIRHVPLPNGRRGENIEEDILYEREEYRAEEIPPSSGGRRLILWCATFLFVLLLGVALSTSFSGATVVVTPKAELVAVDHEFTASKSADGKLRFQALPIQETAEKVIPADTTKKVTEKATGNIIIYNNFSDKPQRLIKNTRFETESGLIYRIGSSVTVPGKTVKDSKTIPGSVEVAVTADSPGKDYNIPLSDFTVPGFKGDAARFAGFYARSKTPMAGGFDGTVRTPSEKALETARASLQTGLEEKIAKEKRAIVPEGYILFDGGVALKLESLMPEERKDDLAAVKERAVGAAYIFKKEDIALAIAKAVLPTTNELPVEIPELDTLIFELREQPTGNLSETDAIRFKLKGSVRILWLYDVEKLQNALIGKPKEDLAATLAAFPTIEKVDLVLRPFWSRSFPDKPEKVKIERASHAAAPKAE